MDRYSVKLMSRAQRDLEGIYDYIARTLLEPAAFYEELYGGISGRRTKEAGYRCHCQIFPK